MSELIKTSGNVIVRLFGLALDSLQSGTVWVADKAEAYVNLLRRGLVRIGLLSLIPIGLYAFGAAWKVAWLLSLAMILFGLLIVGLMIIAAPILTGVAAAARAFPSVSKIVSGVGAAALFFLLTALAFQFIPINAGTVIVVPACAAILGFIWFFTGSKQSLSMIAGKVMSLMVLTVVGPTLTNLFPETAGRLTTLGGAFDRVTARAVSTVGVKADSPARMEIQSLSQFRETRFFHPTKRNETLVWYYRAPEGEIELFSAPGFHPSSGEELKPITSDIIVQLRKKLELEAKEARNSASAPQSARTPPRETASQPTPALVALQALSPLPQPNSGAAAALDQEQKRREGVEAQRKFQEALAVLTRTNQQEQRAIENEFQQAKNEARRASESARVDLERRRQLETSHAQSKCQLAQSALSQVPGLGALAQGSCQQDQAEVQARYQQGLIEVRSTYDAAVNEAQNKRIEQQTDVKARFDLARADLEQNLRSASK